MSKKKPLIDHESIQSVEGAVARGPVYLTSWENWNFSRTLSYWIAVMYLEGSVLFCIGGIFSLTPIVDESKYLLRSLVYGSYFAGGICFGLGAYCGVLQVLNLELERSVPKRRRFVWCGSCSHWRQAAKTNGKSAAAAYLIYFVGAIAFQLSLAGALINEMSVAADYLIYRIPAVIGALCFAGGGLIEVLHNEVCSHKICGKTQIFWLAFCNFVGGVLFLVAATTILIGVNDPNEVHMFEDLPYLVGSALFLIGSMLSLLMWKHEQFGLSLLKDLNKGGKAYIPRHELETEALCEMHSQYGCGKSENSQALWLLLYTVNASASSVLLSLLLADVFYKDRTSLWSINDICNAFVGLALSHGVIALCSVIHHVPTMSPHRQLLWFLRILLVLYTTNAWLQVTVLIEDCLDDIRNSSAANSTPLVHLN